jgi:hypothetical protein
LSLNGIPIALRSAIPSCWVLAVVVIDISIPLIWSTVSNSTSKKIIYSFIPKL